ncbi:S8 family serine peptidase, partial [Microlunatus capsulatus]|uniref:S8 family serine peptidase n=1 Tax=Microlunatus capsulatus TaxID=99117 RepID=UPI0031E0F06D
AAGSAVSGAAAAAFTGGRTTYLVEATTARAASRAARRAEADGGTVTRRYREVLEGFAAQLTPRQARTLRAQRGVLTVTPDRKIIANACPGCLPGALSHEEVANWGVLRLSSRTPVTLDPQEPGGPVYRFDSDGEGVTAVVLDTGVDAVPELGDRVRPGHDFVDDDRDARDCGGHGTRVAEIVAGDRTGVADRVAVVPLRVFDCSGTGSWSRVLAALDWTLRHRPDGPVVVNLSGAGHAFGLGDRAVRRVVAAGIPVVASAGNVRDDACRYSPARVPGVLTVGATDITDRRAATSDFGRCLDLFAPGVDIATTSGTVSGTSFAAAHATGAVARYLENHRRASPRAVAAALTAEATTGVVRDLRGSPDRLLHVADPVAPGAPVQVSWTVDDAADTATATWSPPAERGSAPLTGYLVCASPVQVFNSWPGPQCGRAAAGARTLTLGLEADGLFFEANGTYAFFVAALSKAGTGTPSPAAELRFAPSPPSDPTVVVSLQLDSGGILVQVTSNDAPWNGYVEYTVTRTGPDLWGEATRTETTTADAFFGGLVPGETYTFAVQARNVSGTSGVVTREIRYPG